MEYKLDIKQKHIEREDVVERLYVKLRKSINKRIFQSIEHLSDIPERYYIAKRISERLFEYESDLTMSSILGIGLRRALSEGHRVCIDSLIQNEYAYILRLQGENERLKRELSFYKELSKNK
ncbi:hypothetical protein D0T49_04375 [Paludibacter sp. 221]|uniref:hypothetical protein n=1 Tax=Paludibacter sp. 221 TaxID=2302939 RepID=UPI0013D6692E|nr:hypothetical protein [Paludibacter sp. 221]NDV46274.1 hypothetical protein [Paludibacter sp. 221]